MTAALSVYLAFSTTLRRPEIGSVVAFALGLAPENPPVVVYSLPVAPGQGGNCIGLIQDLDD